ncbi:serpin-ZX [Daucus carota subsp. sativus]|uniref:serpin-ZX n=1 Tax=Daucus carota subsp. sativus TaxID=79200 RepID=UPI003082FDCA
MAHNPFFNLSSKRSSSFPTQNNSPRLNQDDQELPMPQNNSFDLDHHSEEFPDFRAPPNNSHGIYHDYQEFHNFPVPRNIPPDWTPQQFPNFPTTRNNSPGRTPQQVPNFPMTRNNYPGPDSSPQQFSNFPMAPDFRVARNNYPGLDQGPRKNQVDVSLTLAKHFLLNYGKDSNLVFSPISIQVVLSLLAAGSNGQTRDQLLSFLKAESVDELNSVYALLVDVVFADGSSSGGPRVSVANGVWLDESLSFKDAFQQVAETMYKAASHRVDFQNKAEEVKHLVNSWVEKETCGLIKNILNSVERSTQLILANALYFKGEWSSPFDAFLTRNYDFYLLNSSSIQVPFMTSNKDQYISVFDGFKVLELPYQQARNQSWEKRLSFSMYIFLPDAIDGLPALVERAGSEPGFLDRYVPSRRVEVGEFRIPKFKFEYNIEAREALQSLGLVSLFGPSGGLGEMVSNSFPLFVSRIVHKSFIEVDEKGTEAAAATVFCTAPGSSCIPRVKVVIDFVADHPFLFVIRENATGMVEFIGHVLNPSVHA